MPKSQKLDLKVYFKNGLKFSTNDLFVKLKMSTMTGYTGLFHLNVNLFLDYPMREPDNLFQSNLRKSRMFKSARTIKKVSTSQLEINRSKFKRSKSKHIINQFGQVVGIDHDDDEEPKEVSLEEAKSSTSKIKKYNLFDNRKSDANNIHNSSNKKPENNNNLSNLVGSELYEVHDIYNPKKTSLNEADLADLYKTDKQANDNDETTPRHSLLKNAFLKPKFNRDLDSKIKNLKSEIFMDKSTMKLVYTREDLDKPHYKVPDDFELVFNFKCLAVNKVWEKEWLELEELREYVFRRLRKDPKLGEYMCDGSSV